MLTLTAGAPPWWESADILHYVVGLSIKRIPVAVVARLARNAARNRPPGEERELALQTLDRAPDLGLVDIVKHGLLGPLGPLGT